MLVFGGVYFEYEYGSWKTWWNTLRVKEIPGNSKFPPRKIQICFPLEVQPPILIIFQGLEMVKWWEFLERNQLDCCFLRIAVSTSRHSHLNKEIMPRSEKFVNQVIQSALFIQKVGGHFFPLKGSRFHHPKKVTLNHQEAGIDFSQKSLVTLVGFFENWFRFQHPKTEKAGQVLGLFFYLQICRFM